MKRKGIKMDANGMGIIVIAGAGLFLLVYFLLQSLNTGWWKCPACGFRTRSDEEAAGHAALHAQHKPVRES